MKKNYILLLLLCLCFAGCKEKTVVESDYLPIADPYVMLYEGKYYAYGTGGTVEGEGFACFSSDDLKNWTREGQALSAADSYGTWGLSIPLYSLMMTVRLTFISCVLQMATSSGWQR